MEPTMMSEAASAASRVAARHGYEAKDPIVLQETNNSVVWLRPHEIIAKVGKWKHSGESLAREHRLAVALTAEDAPIAPPVAGAEPMIDEGTGFVVTLWHRLDRVSEQEFTPLAVGRALLDLHDHLAGYEGQLPSFYDGLSLARATLEDAGAMRALGAQDRSILRAAFDRLVPEVEAHGFVEEVLHGEPHDGNLLATPAGLRWIDLEAVCTGPLEWDLAFLPEGATEVFPTIDAELLGLLRTLNSARVATWCWARAEFDEMRRHGAYHLEQVRRSEGGSMNPP
jgi:hypothetical protein